MIRIYITFFQLQATIREKNISRIKHDFGNLICDPNHLSHFFVLDFRKCFIPDSTPSTQNMSSFLAVIDNCIIDETNATLIANIFKEEVFTAICSIGGLKAPA